LYAKLTAEGETWIPSTIMPKEGLAKGVGLGLVSVGRSEEGGRRALRAGKREGMMNAGAPRRPMMPLKKE
jgi:hypothetical protein